MTDSGCEAQEVGDFGVGRTVARVGGRRVHADAARVKAAALEALRIACVEVVVRRRLEAERDARGELVEVRRALEIGARRAERNARTAEYRRTAAKVILPQDVCRALVPGVATAERQAELIGQVIGEVAEYGVGLGIDIRLRERREAGEGGEEAHVELRVGIGIEVIGAEQAAQRAAIVPDQLQFLADLVVAVKGRNVEIDCRQRVEIDGRGAFILAVGGDGTQGKRVGDIDRAH